MPDLPLVTIGAINYNNAKYVIETLESIKSQTYRNIELIIVDDCSTDKSFELIHDWLKTYKGICKVIAHEINLGVCATCNDVLRNASGEYISIIATDDIMLPEKIAKQVELLLKTNDDIGAVFSDAYLINEDSSLKKELFIQRYRKFDKVPSRFIYKDLLEGNFLPAMSVMVKKICYNDVGLFDVDLVFEDYDMWLRISKKYKFLYSDFIGVKYRIRQNSLMSATKNWDTSTIRIFAKHIKESPSLLKRLEALGIGSYCNGDKESILSLKPLKGLSLKLKAITFLHYLKIPPVLGLYILKRL